MNAGSVTVSPSIGGLVAGTYTGAINVASPGSANTPQSVTVKLVVTACSFAIASAGAAAPAAVGGGSISVSGPSTCSASVSSSASWIVVTSGSTVVGGGSVTYTLAANTGAQRSGTISVADQLFTITQAAGSPDCVVTFSSANQSVNSAAGSSSTSLGIGANCGWALASDSWWLNLTGAASGSGPTVVPYSFFSNTQTVARTAVLSVGGSPGFYLIQSASSLPYSTREVTLLYQSFLNREPDAGGLSFWTTQPAQNLGSAFYLSGEFQAVQLNLVRLYRVFYGREPDYNTEYLPGTKALRAGASTVSTLSGQLVNSSGGPSASELLSTMCANVNPGAAQSAVAACVSSNAGLVSLAPADAAVQFIHSTSYQGTQSAQRDAVYLMYTITLNRPPDASGFGYWLTTMVQSNYDNLWLVTAFVSSAEFQKRLN
jgi:hypothetical protein